MVFVEAWLRPKIGEPCWPSKGRSPREHWPKSAVMLAIPTNNRIVKLRHTVHGERKFNQLRCNEMAHKIFYEVFSITNKYFVTHIQHWWIPYRTVSVCLPEGNAKFVFFRWPLFASHIHNGVVRRSASRVSLISDASLSISTPSPPAAVPYTIAKL